MQIQVHSKSIQSQQKQNKGLGDSRLENAGNFNMIRQK